MWEARKDIGFWVIQHSLTLEVATSKARRMAGKQERRFKTKEAAEKAAKKMNDEKKST